MNKPRSYRGQAAMEYLMTYGWAILIVLAIMGILVYLVKPQPVNSCNVATPLQCEPDRFSAATTGNVSIDLANTGSVGFYVANTTCANQTYDYTSNGQLPGLALSAGGDSVVYFNCSNSPNLVKTAVSGKDTFQETVEIVYYPVGSPTFAQTQQIQISVRYK